jgi:hypothetical protein
MEQRREGGRRGATGGRMTDHAGAALGQPRGGGEAGGVGGLATDHVGAALNQQRRRVAQPMKAAWWSNRGSRDGEGGTASRRVDGMMAALRRGALLRPVVRMTFF